MIAHALANVRLRLSTASKGLLKVFGYAWSCQCLSHTSINKCNILCLFQQHNFFLMADKNKKPQAKKQAQQSAPATPAQNVQSEEPNIFQQLVNKVSGMFSSAPSPSVQDYTPLVMKGALDKKPVTRKKKGGPTDTSEALAQLGIIPSWVPTKEQPDMPAPMGIRMPLADEANLVVTDALKRFKFLEAAKKAGQKAGINPLVLAGLAKQESSWNPNAISRGKSGNPIAYGLTQFKPDTFKQFYPGKNGNIMNPEHSLMASANYLNYLLKTQPDEIQALRAYNQGPGNQRRMPYGTGPHSHFYPYQVMDKAIESGYLPIGGISAVVPYKYRIPAAWQEIAERDIRASYPIPMPTPTTPKKATSTPAKKTSAKPAAKRTQKRSAAPAKKKSSQPVA